MLQSNHETAAHAAPPVQVVGMEASDEVLGAVKDAAVKGYHLLLKNEFRMWQQLALFIKEAMEAACKGAWHVIQQQQMGQRSSSSRWRDSDNHICNNRSTHNCSNRLSIRSSSSSSNSNSNSSSNSSSVFPFVAIR
ncbi:hypothetical protein Emag_006606 [Eimeria magna]